ncbi:glutamine synthetase family protein [Streptomyces europaeiscabiei]|uniref:glutamine synthetase family protein n=1 Tax=Streptomyces europaeiscabiei TaxID=146819 RepID=UPI002E19A55D
MADGEEQGTEPATGLTSSDSRNQLREDVGSGEITRVLLAVPDMYGQLKGKVLDAEVLLERMGSAAEMCAYILATDLNMTPLDDYDLTGWKHGYGDLAVKADLGTVRMLPYQVGTAIVVGDAFNHDGSPVEVAPRNMLRRQLERLSDVGYHVSLGIESEFLLLAGTPDKIRRAGYRDLRPAWPTNLDYALGHPPKISDFFRDLHSDLRLAGIPVEAIKTEGAAGQVEVTFAHGDPMAACDAYPVFRLITDDLAQRHGMTPVWMATPFTGTGSGLHLHVSLWSANGTAFTYHRGQDLPPAMERAIAGLISGMPSLAPLYAPFTNSYKRFRPHTFAPTRHTWGFDNRGCAVRITGVGKGAHLEIRLPGADANPYLALAASCASISHGFQDQPELTDPCHGDAYTALAVPIAATLTEASAHFSGGKVPLDAFGETVVRHFTRAARAEIQRERTQVTDIEREYGFGCA